MGRGAKAPDAGSTTVRPPRVLVCGLGVAGATLAWWLDAYGFEVTVVECAAGPRTGGYMIDFWGPGYDVAEHMGAIDRLRATGYLIDEVRLVRRNGRRLATIGARAVRDLLGDRFFSLLRGDLAGLLHRLIIGRVDIRFGRRVRALRQRADGCDVEFDDGATAAFELVLGADGVHSQIRGLVDPDAREQPLGLWAAAFSASGYPHRDPGAYVSRAEVGRQAARYALRDGRSAFFLIARSPERSGRPPAEPSEQKAWLRAQFGGGWEGAEMLRRLDACDDLYFDAVAQVRSGRWSNGRVALVGDAAWAPSLLAGEGASLAMAGAYVLAGELDRCCGDYAAAFARYEHQFRPLTERRQRSALRIGGWFAPRDRMGLLLRNLASRLAARPPIARLLFGGMLADPFELPEYRPVTVPSL